MRGLGLGFTNPVGTWGVLDVCFGCGGVVVVVCHDQVRRQVSQGFRCLSR